MQLIKDYLKSRTAGWYVSLASFVFGLVTFIIYVARGGNSFSPVSGAAVAMLVLGWATNLQPFLMGIVVSAVVGIVLTLPISSAAICAAMGISGGAVLAALGDGSVTIEVWNGLALAGGAATIGCCTHMLGFATLSYPDNGIGGFVAQGLGTSMLQVPNLMKEKVRLWFEIAVDSINYIIINNISI